LDFYALEVMMPTTISAEKITLYDLEQRFRLQRSNDTSFFSEWQESLPTLTPFEQQRLEHLRAVYANLSARSVLETTVKMAIVSPLLDLAGFYLPPFYVSTEEEVQVQSEDGETTVRGKIDVLVLKDQFWLIVIESKRAAFSLQVGIPQALAYMLATPTADRPLYGLVTNGSHFMFLKLMQQPEPTYQRSREFLLEEEGQLEQVLQILKRLAAIVADSPDPFPQ